MENHGFHNKVRQGDNFQELSIEEMLKRSSTKNLQARREIVIKALEKVSSREEKNDNIKKLIKRYEKEKKIISDILSER